MKIKQTIILAFAMLIGIGSLFIAPTVSAVEYCGKEDDGITPRELKPGQSCCGGAVTSVIECGNSTSSTEIKDSGIWKLLLTVINILTAGVGVAAVAGIVYGSILYASAADSSEQVKKAISIIVNVVVGLLAYAFMYAFLNFIIPGGLFT